MRAGLLVTIAGCLAVGCRWHFELTTEASTDASVDVAETITTLRFGERPTADYRGVSQETQISENSTQAAFNYGGFASMGVSAPAPFRLHALVRFDVQALPPGTRVVAAHLAVMRWVQGDERTGSIRVWALEEAWEEGTNMGSAGPGANWMERATQMAWMTAGGTASQQIGSLNIAGPPQTEIALDIATVQRWIDDPTTNAGVMFAPDGDIHCHFYASEATEADYRPELVLDVVQ